MIFSNNEYYHPMDREYAGNNSHEPKIEEPLFKVSEIGMTVTEGRGQGTFLQSVTAAIRQGAGRLELSTQMEGSDMGVGAEAYSTDAREAIRELTKINEVKIHSIHTPAQIGNVSGLGQQGFSDDQRDKSMQEINKAIEFARDVSNGASIVVHTGEFPREIVGQKWAKDEKGREIFRAYEEEAQDAVMHIVDDRTGQIMQTVKKNQIVSRPVWLKQEKGDYHTLSEDNAFTGKKTGEKVYVAKDQYVDYEGNPLGRTERVARFNDKTGRFDVKKAQWKDFEEEAIEINGDLAKEKNMSVEEFQIKFPDKFVKPEEAFFRATLEIQEGHSRGWAMTYARDFREEIDTLKKLRTLKTYYEKIEAETDQEEKWKLQRLIPSKYSQMVPPDVKNPVDQINHEITQLKKGIEYSRQASASQEQQAEEAATSQKHAVSISKYALNKSFDSLARTGIHALKETNSERLRRKEKEEKTGFKQDKMDAIFIAPENIFPEMGYGSHPDELIALVDGARSRMVELLTKKKIKGSYDVETEDHKLVDNPMYNKKYANDPKLAKKIAEDHIKATFDTQHLGMWRKHFKPHGDESQKETNARFEKWYMKQVEKMHDKGIIGNIHIVDGFGRGHTHLAAGQGDLPVVSAVTWLKEHGYVGNMSSEGFGEPTRQLTETWRAFGANVYGGSDSAGIRVGAPSQSFKEIHQSYFGQTASPYFVFGAYSPSNDWTLWSQTPME